MEHPDTWITVQLHGIHSLIIPDDLAMAMLKGGKKRVVVHARHKDKEVRFHAALQKIKGAYRIMFSKKHQKTIGVSPTEPFEIRLSPDTSKYGVEVPEEFQAVLESDPEAFTHFEQLSDGLKRSLIYFVKRFRNSQTRIDKSLIIANNLAMGIRDGKELVVDRR